MNRVWIALLALALALLCGCSRLSQPERETRSGTPAPAPAESASPSAQPLAVYLGVEHYGRVDAAQKDAFRYRFSTGGETVTYAIAPDAAYTIQNLLEEGGVYALTVEQDTVVAAEAVKPVSALPERSDYDRVVRVRTEAGGAVLEEGAPEAAEPVSAVLDEASRTLYLLPAAQSYTPPVSGTPGERTLLNFLKTAMTPVGTTLYVYGGGWNWQDDAAARQAASIGLPEEWVTFFQTRGADYHYKLGDAAHSFYPFGGWNEYYFAGADCSGYVGWALYNTLYDSDGEAGLVFFADRVASELAERHWGTIVQGAQTVRPGDIMSMSGHVWIALGTCDDGSIVIAHSTPSAGKTGALGGGVQLSAVGSGTGCEAYRLAQDYMTRYYPAWSERYAAVVRAPGSYLAGSLFRWDTQTMPGLSDPDGVQQMDAATVLRLLFANTY